MVYIFVSIPASWVIDTYGLRVGVGIGAVLTGVFGLLRGLAGDNYTTVLLAQIGIAVAQPFLLNAITTVAARWFPIEERATASGLGTLVHVRRPGGGAGADPVPGAGNQHPHHAAHLRRRGRSRLVDLPAPGQRAPAHTGFSGRDRTSGRWSSTASSWPCASATSN